MKTGVYLGFPSVGKTPMAKREYNVIDLDAGHVRAALARMINAPESEVDDAELARFTAYLADCYVKEGWAVITNHPGVAKYLTVARMYVPNARSEKAVERAASKLGVDRDTAQTYIEDWTLVAKTNGIPLTVLRKGLDYIFRQHNLKMQTHSIIVQNRPNAPVVSPITPEPCDDDDNDKDDRKMGEFW